MNRSSAHGRSARKYSSCPLEMFIPVVRARMEESYEFACAWICSAYVWALVPVAVQAGESEVLKNC
jgi:hypothetical protein